MFRCVAPVRGEFLKQEYKRESSEKPLLGLLVILGYEQQQKTRSITKLISSHTPCQVRVRKIGKNTLRRNESSTHFEISQLANFLYKFGAS